jgi:hypothetical protein
MLISRHAADNLIRSLKKHKPAEGALVGVASSSIENQGVENKVGGKTFGLQLQGLGRLVAWCVSHPYVMIASAVFARHLNSNSGDIPEHDKDKGKRKLPSRDDQVLTPGPVHKFQHFVGAAAAFVSALKPPMPLKVRFLPGK